MRKRDDDIAHHSVLVVLGKNIGIGSSPRVIRKDNFHLSHETRINVLACGMLYQPGMDIICSSGETSGPPSEARAMKNYLLLHFPQIPRNHIILEEHKNSIDTAGNAEEVAKIVKARGYKYVGLVTVGYHLNNAAILCERYGVPIGQKFIAEHVVQKRSVRHKQYIMRWEKTGRIQQEKRKEALRKLLLRIDRKGKFLRLLTQRTRH
ncbi:MAG TPA: YdcF family protein [Ktedonobacteraceae bacterium]|nr:YdcF family protein [Ktedonobacteraceae bacterium]